MLLLALCERMVCTPKRPGSVCFSHLETGADADSLGYRYCRGRRLVPDYVSWIGPPLVNGVAVIKKRGLVINLVARTGLGIRPSGPCRWHLPCVIWVSFLCVFCRLYISLNIDRSRLYDGSLPSTLSYYDTVIEYVLFCASI
jgi:hypothetical protein